MPARKAIAKITAKKGSAQKPATYKVFISHSSYDLWIAKQMAKEINALKVETWLDEKDLEGGDILAEAILKGIRACQETIVLVSTKSIASQWVAYEIGATRSLKKRVTPILNNVPADALKVTADVKAIELNQFDQYLLQLKQRAKK
jgi:hypothetical protein